MATLSAQAVVEAGLEASYSAAAAGGDEWANTGSEFIHVKNGARRRYHAHGDGAKHGAEYSGIRRGDQVERGRYRHRRRGAFCRAVSENRVQRHVGQCTDHL